MSLVREMGEPNLEPGIAISYSAGVSACEKSVQWQRAMALVSETWEAKLEPNGISYSAGISACEKCDQWQRFGAARRGLEGRWRRFDLCKRSC